jgi:uncharacterized membrane protein YkoI
MTMKMNIKMVMSLVVWGMLASGASAGWFGFGENEQDINIKQLPPAVVKTVMRIFPEGDIIEAEKETEHGKVSYDVSVRNGERLYSVETDSNGILKEVEREKRDKGDRKEGKDDKDEKEIKSADLPAAVRAAAMSAVPGGVISDADWQKDDGVMMYEVDVKVNGVEKEVLIKADGTVVKVSIEDDDDDDDDDDAAEE